MTCPAHPLRVPGVRLTRPEIAWLVIHAGARGDAAATAVAIAHAESGGCTNAYRGAARNPDGGNDHGLWQVNDKWHPDVPIASLYFPLSATEVAARISGGWQDFSPWMVYRRGNLDLAAARSAVEAPADPSARLAAVGIPLRTAPSSAIDASALDQSAEDGGGSLPWWARLGQLGNRPGGAGAAIADAVTGGAVTGPIRTAGDAVRNALNPLAAIGTFLATIADRLFSREWWMRAGLFVLGAGLVVVAIALTVRGNVASLVPIPD